TTTVANAMLVAHYTYASSASFTPGSSPGPMTETYDVFFSPSGATGQTLESAYVLQGTAGSTGVYSATASAYADFGNTHLLALRPQPASELDVTRPANVLANDVLIAAIGFRPHTLSITAPSGWTLVQRTDNASGEANSLAVYRRLAGAAEPAAYQWSFAGGTLNAASGGIQAFAGVHTSNPIDVASGQATASGTQHATPGITTSVANAMLVTAHTMASSSFLSPATGMSAGYNRANLAVPNAAGQAIGGAYVLQAVAGATGVKTASASNDADTGNAHILALRPAPVLLYFVHVDHLNTPRLIADNTQTTVWKWEQAEPFGNSVPNEDPDGNSVNFEFPLRLPGQYADKETNLAYNYYRDYDPGIGRYIQSDPIGLAGGINTYTYVEGNPISFVDSFGLEIIWNGHPKPNEAVVNLIKKIDELNGDKNVHVTSTVRDEAANKAAGGAPNSPHMTGRAADIYVPGQSSAETAAQAVSAGAKGVGTYDRSKGGHTHIDDRLQEWNGHNSKTMKNRPSWRKPTSSYQCLP
ncbi:MAG: RHS repeat-associated core domain-containing protein, partial [Burkholderiales bacterium]